MVLPSVVRLGKRKASLMLILRCQCYCQHMGGDIVKPLTRPRMIVPYPFEPHRVNALRVAKDCSLMILTWVIFELVGHGNLITFAVLPSARKGMRTDSSRMRKVQHLKALARIVCQPLQKPLQRRTIAMRKTL